YQSHTAAIGLREQASREEKIDCDFKRIAGLLFPLPSDAPDELEKELAAAQRAGFTGAEIRNDMTLAGRSRGRCIRFPNQGRFQPLKFIYGLAKVLDRRGVKIYTGCRVKDVQGLDAKKGEPARALIDDGPAGVTADSI